MFVARFQTLGGSALGALPVNAKGRYGGENLSTIQAHSGNGKAKENYQIAVSI